MDNTDFKDKVIVDAEKYNKILADAEKANVLTELMEGKFEAVLVTTDKRARTSFMYHKGSEAHKKLKEFNSELSKKVTELDDKCSGLEHLRNSLNGMIANRDAVISRLKDKLKTADDPTYISLETHETHMKSRKEMILNIRKQNKGFKNIIILLGASLIVSVLLHIFL